MPHRLLVLGGARSGKSAYAEARTCALSQVPIYLATCPPPGADGEMAARIEAHRRRRVGMGWQTIEEPLAIAPVLTGAKAGTSILVDCLTLWLANLMEEHPNDPAAPDVALQALVVALAETLAEKVVLVSNEVGLGLVPETPLGRNFRDWQGRFNQHLAAVCDEVVLVVAGLPMSLKSPSSQPL